VIETLDSLVADVKALWITESDLATQRAQVEHLNHKLDWERLEKEGPLGEDRSIVGASKGFEHEWAEVALERGDRAQPLPETLKPSTSSSTPTAMASYQFSST
jgi:hypothetical protein